MTIGEKLLKLHPYRQKDGVFDFKYHVQLENGKIGTKEFKGRLDHEFVTADDGSDYAGGRAEEANIRIRREFDIQHYMKFVRYYGEEFIEEQKEYIFESMLLGIAVKQCRMLSPIHITYYTDGLKEVFEGTALIDISELRPIDKLKYDNNG